MYLIIHNIRVVNHRYIVIYNIFSHNIRYTSIDWPEDTIAMKYLAYSVHFISPNRNNNKFCNIMIYETQLPWQASQFVYAGLVDTQNGNLNKCRR